MSYLEEDRKQAEQGNSTGQYNLGLAYWQGDGINKDLKEAESWFTKAAQQENIEAYSALGGVYMQMENYQKSIEFYELAVDKGSASAECILGEIYYHGLYSEFGIDKDYNKAFILIKKAAIRILTGASNHAKAQCLLGHMYINAHGTEQNFEEGLVWLKRSAAHGYADAEATIGMIYKKGLGVKQDFNEALTWFEKAGAQGHLKACKWAGILHLKQENFKGAAFFLQLASQMDDQEAEELCKKHELWNFKFQ